MPITMKIFSPSLVILLLAASTYAASSVSISIEPPPPLFLALYLSKWKNLYFAVDSAALHRIVAGKTLTLAQRSWAGSGAENARRVISARTTASHCSSVMLIVAPPLRNLVSDVQRRNEPRSFRPRLVLAIESEKKNKNETRV